MHSHKKSISDVPNGARDSQVPRLEMQSIETKGV